MEVTVQSQEITRLLLEMRNGNQEAGEEVIPLVFQELKRVARKLLRNERRDHTLQPTALVNDALLRMIGSNSLDWQSRAHFFSVAATVMRHILVDYARTYRSKKRGGGLARVPLEEGLAYEWREPETLLALNRALDQLAEYDARMSKVVEMRFFAGMNDDEIAEVLHKSVRTVKRDWRFARDWLYAALSKSPRTSSDSIHVS